MAGPFVHLSNSFRVAKGRGDSLRFLFHICSRRSNTRHKFYAFLIIEDGTRRRLSKSCVGLIAIARFFSFFDIRSVAACQDETSN